MNLEQFKKDRNEALLSMDETKIRAYLKKYGQDYAPEGELFWAEIHKARTGIPSLPYAERLASKKWLQERYLSSMDDGELN